MADHQIRCTAPEVRALLAGTKTQKRLALKKDDICLGIIKGFREDFERCGWHILERDNILSAAKPKYNVNDRLWVREAWRADKQIDAIAPRDMSKGEPILYEADGMVREWGCTMIKPGKLRPSMFMPRWASRITLVVTEVRVQRLQDISEEDAVAEGVERLHHGWYPYGIATFMTTVIEGREVPAQCCRTAKQSYAMLWNYINGPGSWEENPWVAAYSFTVHRCNIDQMEAAE